MRPGVKLFHAPGRLDFKKEQAPLAILRYQPTVSRWFFRCLGAHLLRSPWTVKSGLIRLARICFGRLRYVRKPAESLGPPAPSFVLSAVTSPGRTRVITHTVMPFVVAFACFGHAREIKNPASFRQAGWRNFPVLLPACLQSIHGDAGIVSLVRRG
jgi:hypothetical protein